jgi:DNA-binding MarR family transcriptional regulator
VRRESDTFLAVGKQNRTASSLRPASTRRRTRLEPAQLEAWSGLLRAQASVARELDRRLQRGHGLSLRDHDLLEALAGSRRRRLRMSALASDLSLSPSRITRVVAALEERGWVERVAATDDGRGADASLTAEGRAVLRRSRATYAAVVRERFLDPLSERDVRALARAWRAFEP